MSTAALPASPDGGAPRCLVLGGSGHVGSALVRQLVRAGADVQFTWHRQAEAASRLAAECGAVALQWTAGAPLPALADGAPLAALVHCIGTGGPTQTYEREGALADFLGDTADGAAIGQDPGLPSAVAACRAMVPRLARPANIVFVGSIAGVKTVPAPVRQATTQSALLGLTRGLAKALGGHGVCVNLVAVGLLDGGVGLQVPAALRAPYLEHCSLGRLGRADEVAALAAWLALRNRYVNAQAIVLDGGV